MNPIGLPIRAIEVQCILRFDQHGFNGKSRIQVGHFGGMPDNCLSATVGTSRSPAPRTTRVGPNHISSDPNDRARIRDHLVGKPIRVRDHAGSLLSRRGHFRNTLAQTGRLPGQASFDSGEGRRNRAVDRSRAAP